MMTIDMLRLRTTTIHPSRHRVMFPLYEMFVKFLCQFTINYGFFKLKWDLFVVFWCTFFGSRLSCKIVCGKWKKQWEVVDVPLSLYININWIGKIRKKEQQFQIFRFKIQIFHYWYWLDEKFGVSTWFPNQSLRSSIIDVLLVAPSSGWWNLYLF